VDIEKLIQKEESENTEFKQNFNTGTAITFTNTKGGIILIGVSDNGEVKGRKVNYELGQVGQNKSKMGQRSRKSSRKAANQHL